MTASPVPAVIPSAQSHPRPSIAAAAARLGGPLPLAELTQRPAGSLRFGLASIDTNGRVVDSALIRTLGWTTATRLRIQTCVDLIVVLADRHGVFRLGPPGYLRLPATARHWCGLRAGDRLLLAADPANSLLVVHPPAVLEEMVAGLHAARFREGAA